MEQQYKDYTIKVFWDEECQSWLYDICHPTSGAITLDYMGSNSETKTLQAAKDEIDQEIARLAKIMK